MADIIQQLLDLKEWGQNPERYERRLNFRGAGLVQPGPEGVRQGYAGEKIKLTSQQSKLFEEYKKIKPNLSHDGLLDAKSKISRGVITQKSLKGVAKRLTNIEAIKNYIGQQGKVIDGYEFKELLSELGYQKPRDIVKGLEEGGMFAEDILGDKTITKTKRPLRRGHFFSKGQETVLNQYAALLNKQQPEKYTSSNWRTLEETERRNVIQRARDTDWTFKATTKWDPLTDIQKTKIIDAFDLPEDAFKRAAGIQANVKNISGKYGVTRYLESGKKNPLYDKIQRYVKNNFKFPQKDRLPVANQRDIVARYELPKGFEKWDFEKYKYGVPSGGRSGVPNAFTKRISDFVQGKARFPNLAADVGTPQGWMMYQMNRTYDFEKGRIPKNKLTYKPIFEKINDKQKIIGFMDNTPSGKGNTYFSIKKWHDKYGGESLTSHSDFKNVSKFVDIANRAYAEPSKVIMGLLKKGGVVPATGKLQLKHVLNYLAETQGYKASEKAIVLHHQSGVGARGVPGQATKDLQLLRSEANLSIMQAEHRIRKAAFNNLAPNVEDITKLENLGASVKVGGKTFGAGSQTAIGQFKEIQKGAETAIKGWDAKDFRNFKTYIKKIGCPGLRLASQGGGDIDCAARGVEKIKTGQIKAGAEEFNFRKLAKLAGGAKGIARVTGLGLAWEAAFAPLIMGWMASEGESWERMKHDLSYGPILEALGVSPKYVPGKSEKEELKEHMGETGFNVNELLKLYGEGKFLPDWDPSGTATRYDYTPGRRDWLQMDLENVMEETAATRKKVPGWKSYKQYQIEEQLKKLDERGRKLVDPFYEGPAGQYFGEEKWMAGEQARAEGLASLEEAKAAKLKEYREKRYVAPENWWDNQIGRRYAGGGIANVRRPNAIPPVSGPVPQGGGLSTMFNRVKPW